MKIRTIKKLHKNPKNEVVYLKEVGGELCMRVFGKTKVYGNNLPLEDGVKAKGLLISKGYNTLFLLKKLGEEGYEQYIKDFAESQVIFGKKFKEIDIPTDLDYPVYLIVN